MDRSGATAEQKHKKWYSEDGHLKEHRFRSTQTQVGRPFSSLSPFCIVALSPRTAFVYCRWGLERGGEAAFLDPWFVAV